MAFPRFPIPHSRFPTPGTRDATVFDAFRQTQAVRKLGPKGRHDPWLLLAITGLVAFGIVMVASSSIAVADGQHIGEFHYLTRHLIFLAAGGVLALWIALRVELDNLEKY